MWRRSRTGGRCSATWTWSSTSPWYRTGADRRFRPLAAGLQRLIRACEAESVRRFIQISVPEATPHIEHRLPYMVRKREVDRALSASRLSYSILRPTMLFAPRDVLVTVMLRTMARWHRFPMFGDGEYHVSPLAARDLARIVRRELTLDRRGVVDAGGPTRWRYHDLTDLLFASLGRPARYLPAQREKRDLARPLPRVRRFLPPLRL